MCNLWLNAQSLDFILKILFFVIAKRFSSVLTLSFCLNLVNRLNLGDHAPETREETQRTNISIKNKLLTDEDDWEDIYEGSRLL